LASLKFVENKMKQDRQGKLVVVSSNGGPDEGEIRAEVQNDGFVIASSAFATAEGTQNWEWSCELRWKATAADTKVPRFVRPLIEGQSVVRLYWTPQAR
jgi:hypothetical protein